MIICIAAPPDDPEAEEYAKRIRKDGFCPFQAEGIHMGFIRAVERLDSGYLITIEVTEPEIEEHFRSLKGNK